LRCGGLWKAGLNGWRRFGTIGADIGTIGAFVSRHPAKKIPEWRRGEPFRVWGSCTARRPQKILRRRNSASVCASREAAITDEANVAMNIADIKAAKRPSVNVMVSFLS
jgi:hypothetical protein